MWRRLRRLDDPLTLSVERVLAAWRIERSGSNTISVELEKLPDVAGLKPRLVVAGSDAGDVR